MVPSISNSSLSIADNIEAQSGGMIRYLDPKGCVTLPKQRVMEWKETTYDHLSVNDCVDFGQSPISSLVIHQPFNRPTNHSFINVDSCKLLSLAEYSHYKSGQPGREMMKWSQQAQEVSQLYCPKKLNLATKKSKREPGNVNSKE